MQASRNILGSICVSVRGVTAGLAAKRLLVWPVPPIDVVTPMAFLRGVSTPDSGCGYAALGRIPGKLLRNMTEVLGPHVRIHGPRFVTHSSNGKLLISKLTALMLLEAAVDGPIDLLPHMTDETLPGCA